MENCIDNQKNGKFPLLSKPTINAVKFKYGSRKINGFSDSQNGIQKSPSNRKLSNENIKKKLTRNGKRTATNDEKNFKHKNKSLSFKVRQKVQKSEGSMANVNQKFKDSQINNNFYNPSKKQRDPFMMVDFHQFSDNLIFPFGVKIKLDALAIMDLHAHCILTEVIGCLGGYYCNVTKTLHILVAEPCISIDDHQAKCEMDPVSQALALEKLEKKNCQLVGWYHSHPTFPPNPSIRDMDTQNYYQNLFTDYLTENSQKKTKKNNYFDKADNKKNYDEDNIIAIDDQANICPFVAFIISPYIPLKNNLKNCLTSKSFTRYRPTVERPNSVRFFVDNANYKYPHDYNKSYCYFTNELNSVLASPIKCFWIGNSKYSKTLTKQNCLIPYEIETMLIRDEQFIPTITKRLTEMCKCLFNNSKSIIDLFKRYTRIGSINVSYLEKLIASLSYHLQNSHAMHICDENERERLRLECVSILITELIENTQRKRTITLS